MKRLSLLIGFAFLTFCLSVGLTLAYLRILQPSSIASYRQIVSSSKEAHGEAVKIMLKRTFRNEYNIIAEFEVVNGSGEALYYWGSSEGSNPSQSVMRGNRSEDYSPACSVGRTEQVLLPGKSVLFQVAVGEREAGNIKMGFNFIIKGRDERGRPFIQAIQTIWSDDLYVPEP